MEFLSFALLILSFAAGEEVQDFPESCQKELQLGSKKYRVTSRTVIHQSCSIHGDVEVELHAPLLFDAVELHGSVTFLATASFHEACLSVAGPMKIHGSVEFRSCRNNATGSPGGAVYVGGDLHVDGSARFQNCHAESAGGAIYVDGDFWQSGGTMQFDNCSAENGGALSVHGGLQQSGGTLSFGGCSARKWGGAIHLEGDLQHSGGSVNVHDCTASEGGGLYLKEHIVDWTAGSMFASNCSSSRGGAMVAKSLVQSGGQLDFESCGASIEAGVLHLQQDLNQTAGSMSFKGGFAAARGGCAIIENRFWQMGGSMLFSNCTSQRSHGGAIHVGHRGFGGLKASGKLTFRGCSSNSGGAIKVTAGGAEFSNGTFLFEDCIADTGGAVSVSAGHFIHSSGSSTFSRCRALTSVGGALKVEGAQSLFKMRGGSMRFSDCWAFSNGGALFVMKGLRQQGGDIELMNCSSTSQGGGIYIGLRDGGNLEQDAGSISLNKCYVAGGDFQFGFGGGISVGDSVRQSGTIRLENCHVEGGSGGGMKVRRMLNVSGSMSFSSCRATKDGGAFTADSVYVEGGAKLSFDKCRAKAGGALKLDMGFEQQGGDVSFRNCSTWNVGAQVLKLMSENARHGRGGGAIWIRNGNLMQTAGGLRFYGCGGVKGGAVYISEGHLILKGGKQDYVECVASSGGGGVFLHKGHVFQQKTDLTFQSCKAQRKGGAVDVSHGSYYQSPGTLLNITKCVARDHGGGLFASESLHLADVDFRENFAWGSGMAAIARDDVVMDSMHFTGDGESVISAPLVVVQKTVNCTASQQCRLRAREVQVNEFLCPIGAGRYKGRLAEGCLPCVAGRVQILEETNASCAPCPSNSFCSAQYLRAFPGYMLSSDNISRMYHCPNSMACPGGDLPNKTKPMCGNGYTGLGCAECETATHGKSDVDILQCIPCANERWLQAMQISWLIIKDALAFGIAGASLIGDSLEEKQSNVLLNQFMAFAVVAGSTLSSTMNTKTLKQFSSRNSDIVWWSGLLQPDAGASLECILGYLGLPKTVWHSHLISSVTPVLLMLLFAVIKDVPSALMVGSNCFLPRFWGDVGRFFVCYRIEPEADGGQQICRFLPPQPWALLALFVLLFLGVLLGWWRSVTAAERQRAHVIYLTRGYQPRYASWELERLVRKMVLRLFTALLPVTLFPALHMAGNTLVLLFAWTVHLHVAPYQRAKWNVTEALLLTTALLMTILSNCMIANDSHWGHSVLTQYVLFFVIVSLALVASLVILVMFLLQVYQERFAPQDVEKKTLEE